jgi:hypothetical protein
LSVFEDYWDNNKFVNIELEYTIKSLILFPIGIERKSIFIIQPLTMIGAILRIDNYQKKITIEGTSREDYSHRLATRLILDTFVSDNLNLFTVSEEAKKEAFAFLTGVLKLMI